MSSYLNGIIRKITASSQSSTSPPGITTPISGLCQDPSDPERGDYKGKPVSIFCPAHPVLVKRLKTLKHPNIIQYILDSDTGNSNSSIWLVTEPVRQLDVLSVVEHKDWAIVLAWQACSAVLFLNRQAGIAHCNLSSFQSCMFIDDQGMFKLGGLEASLCKRDPGEADRLCRMIGASMDISISDKMLASIDHPPLLSFMQNQLRITNVSSVEQFVSDHESHRLVQLVTRLDSLHIDIDLDKMATVKAATLFCQSPSCPKPLLFKVLLSVFQAFQQSLDMMTMDTIKLMFDCVGRLLVKSNSQAPSTGAVYQKRCLDIYGALLSNCKDRNVRLMLIEGVEGVMEVVGDHFCQTTIYPFLTSNLSDSQNASIRDAALRALISLATRSHLSDNVVSGDLLRHLARLQDDSQAGIRANLLIGLSKLGTILPADVRSKTIGPAYCRGLTDPFGPSKVAALNGLLESGKSCSRQEIAERLLPHICPLMVEKDAEIASRAVAVVDLFLSVIKEHTKPWISPVIKPASMPTTGGIKSLETDNVTEALNAVEFAKEPMPTEYNHSIAPVDTVSKPINTTYSLPSRGRLGATRKLQ